MSDKPQTRSGRRERRKEGGNASLNVGTQNCAGVHCCPQPVVSRSKLLLTIEVNTIITSALSSTMGCSSSGPFVLSWGYLQGHIRLLLDE